MKTEKTAENVAEPGLHRDSSTNSSPNSSLETLVYTVEQSDPAWIRAAKILDTAGPAEVLEKPVLLRDGRWLTAEEVVEYAKTLEGYSENN